MKQKFVSSLLLVISLALIASVWIGLRPSAAAPNGEECVDECERYLPVIYRPLPTPTPTNTPTPTPTPTLTPTPTALPLDFTVIDLDIFQAVQTENNEVPLVAGKTAVARIYARLEFGSSPSNVQVSLTAVRNGNNLGTVSTSTPNTVPGSPSHDNYNSTYNIILPNDWLSGQVQLTAKVDSTNAYFEMNESNNQFVRAFTFNNVPDLQIRLIPIDYVHDGPANKGDYPGQSVDYISNWIERAYPMGNINVVIRPHYIFIGDLTNEDACYLGTPECDWKNLLNAITTLKITEGQDPAIVYYGSIPIENGSKQWFYGGIAGIGWIGQRASIGLNLGNNNDTAIIAGHEVGHNLGRRHAPCGVSNPDPSYPHGGGIIGQYGTDIQGSNVTFLSPSSRYDLMSYCQPEWISDYTYKALYNDQQANGLARPAAPADRLFIRASFQDDGGLEMAPTYILFLPYGTETDTSEIMTELLDDNGVIVATHPVHIMEAYEKEFSFRSVIGTVPLPDRPIAKLRLVRDGVVVAEQSLTDAQRMTQTDITLSRSTEDVTLNWGLSDTPAIIRYTIDDGLTWMTLAIDVVGGSYTVPMTMLDGDGRFDISLANSNKPVTLTADFTMP